MPENNEERSVQEEVGIFKLLTYKGAVMFLVTTNYSQLSPQEKLNGLLLIQQFIDEQTIAVKGEINDQKTEG